MSLFTRLFSLLGILTLVGCGNAATPASEASAHHPGTGVESNVQLLADVLNVSKIHKLRGKTVESSSDDPASMLRVYNAKVHPRSGQHNRIVVGAPKVTKGRLVATVAAEAATLADLVGDRADDAVAALKDAGAVFGFDGDGMDGCGNGEIYALVLDRAAARVYSVETAPCEP